MPVYVDDSRWSFGRVWRPIVMCHMVADTALELDAMAERIKLSERWLQYPGERKEHYDVAKTKRELAVKAGAIEITQRELVIKLRDRNLGIYLAGASGGTNDKNKKYSRPVVPLHPEPRDQPQGDVRPGAAANEEAAATQAA